MRIPRTKNTPEVVLNTEEAHLYLIGSSYNEDSINLYKPIHKEIKSFTKKLPESKSFCVSIAMEYLNTGGTHELNRLFRYLSSIDNKVFVLWCWEENDEDMLEQGEVFSNIYPKLNFSYKMIFDPDDISFL